jgi:hypothetical protein
MLTMTKRSIIRLSNEIIRSLLGGMILSASLLVEFYAEQMQAKMNQPQFLYY